MRHILPSQNDWAHRLLGDVMSVLQGKLEGCTVNSQGVILNHTTYYLNPDAHVFTRGLLFFVYSPRTRSPGFCPDAFSCWQGIPVKFKKGWASRKVVSSGDSLQTVVMFNWSKCSALPALEEDSTPCQWTTGEHDYDVTEYLTHSSDCG